MQSPEDLIAAIEKLERTYCKAVQRTRRFRHLSHEDLAKMVTRESDVVEKIAITICNAASPNIAFELSRKECTYFRDLYSTIAPLQRQWDRPSKQGSFERTLEVVARGLGQSTQVKAPPPAQTQRHSRGQKKRLSDVLGVSDGVFRRRWEEGVCAKCGAKDHKFNNCPQYKAAKPSFPADLPKGVCARFWEGTPCRFGDKCKFRHEAKTTQASNKSADAQPPYRAF